MEGPWSLALGDWFMISVRNIYLFILLLASIDKHRCYTCEYLPFHQMVFYNDVTDVMYYIVPV